MRIELRIIIYFGLSVLYWFLTSWLISLDTILETNDLFRTLRIGFVGVGLLYTFLILRLTILWNIVASVIVALVSLFFALKVGNLILLPNYDPYGISISIICNALFSVILWEVIYLLKCKFLIKKA